MLVWPLGFPLLAWPLVEQGASGVSGTRVAFGRSGGFCRSCGSRYGGGAVGESQASFKEFWQTCGQGLALGS